MAKKRRRSDHKGVSIVKRRGVFWIKWRVSSAPGDYRSAWERLPDEVKSREEARPHARRKAGTVAQLREKQKHHRKHNRIGSTVAAGVDDYREAYQRERRARGEAFIKRTLANLDQHLAPFVKMLGKRKCERLTIDDLSDFRKRMADATELQNRSINRTLDAARACLNHMRREGFVFVPKDAIGEALKHYEVEGKSPRVLDLDELRRLIKALAKRDDPSRRAAVQREITQGPRAGTVQNFKQSFVKGRKPLTPFIALALLTGARPGEIEALTVDDVREGHGNILIRASKTANEREVPWHDSPLLRELALSLRDNPVGKNGRLVGTVKRDRVARLGKAAKIDLFTDDKGETRSRVNRQLLRRTTVAHVAAGSTEGEGLLTFRFGHNTATSIKHYRRALHGVNERGSTVEQWLGVENELRDLLTALGFVAPREGKVLQLTKAGA
jgi:integrase